MKRNVKLCISILYFAAMKCRSLLFQIAGKKAGPVYVSLCYHDVKDNEVEKIREQIGILLSRAFPVKTDFNGIPDGRDVYVSLTFDDGYKSIVSIILPVMSGYRIPFTCFVPSGFIGGNSRWKGGDRNCEIMNINDLRTLPGNLVTIGSHTVSHCDIVSLSDEAVFREFYNSRIQLEKVTGKPVRLLSFPYSHFESRHVDAAIRAGYEKVFAGQSVHCSADDSKRLSGRISVTPDDSPMEFSLKVSGAYNWLPSAVKMKRSLECLLRPNRNFAGSSKRLPVVHSHL